MFSAFFAKVKEKSHDDVFPVTPDGLAADGVTADGVVIERNTLGVPQSTLNLA